MKSKLLKHLEVTEIAAVSVRAVTIWWLSQVLIPSQINDLCSESSAARQRACQSSLFFSLSLSLCFCLLFVLTRVLDNQQCTVPSGKHRHLRINGFPLQKPFFRRKSLLVQEHLKSVGCARFRQGFWSARHDVPLGFVSGTSWTEAALTSRCWEKPGWGSAGKAALCKTMGANRFSPSFAAATLAQFPSHPSVFNSSPRVRLKPVLSNPMGYTIPH